eukprot:TRINITY_DN12748_c0_g5_i1.p1 TRINITY_DN12748_c0_g5~~TRINITY_DN12748_c0_g5_i1.p1  ORF type:complete len:704 (+),score=175.44 TRINITY_DN12748_c0_g5_i1:47-2113(+)
MCIRDRFYNTLVCLPTGLGKTFIAATVMYNYYRWFREGLVFFLAPTKPLVDQQYNAFMEIIVGLNESHIGQLTGKQNKKERSRVYATAKVFFMTPQTLANDLKSGLVEKDKVTCVVFDEAHRATGNYAYCIIVKELMEAKTGYRIVALSATPGPNIQSIQQIIENLCIAKVEARSEEDVDVKPYTHCKNIELVRVKKTSEVAKLEELLVKVISIPQGYLQKMHLLPYTKNNKPLNKMMILEAQEKFKLNSLGHSQNEAKMIYSSFSSLLSLLCGLNMLLTHGIDSLKIFCDKFIESVEEKKGRKSIVNSKEFKEVMDYLADINRAKKNHPKLEKMKELLIDFFNDEAHKQSQVIVFTLFVNSAQEICKYLETEAAIQPKIFIGQANGYTQKDQMRIINEFKAHKFNTLVATCIGEEGLDIGYVDLIVSYDCTGSPVRMIQRFGRTGRKQEGKIVILLCNEEEKRYNKMQKMSKSIYGILKNSLKVQQTVFSFFDLNPRMIDEGVTPVCIYATKKEDFNNPKAFDRLSMDGKGNAPSESMEKQEMVSSKNACELPRKKTTFNECYTRTEIEEAKIPKEIKDNKDSKGKESMHEEQRSALNEKDMNLDQLISDNKDDISDLSEETINQLLGDMLSDEEAKTSITNEPLCEDNSSEDILALVDEVLLEEQSKATRSSEVERKGSKKFKYSS